MVRTKYLRTTISIFVCYSNLICNVDFLHCLRQAIWLWPVFLDLLCADSFMCMTKGTCLDLAFLQITSLSKCCFLLRRKSLVARHFKAVTKSKFVKKWTDIMINMKHQSAVNGSVNN